MELINHRRLAIRSLTLLSQQEGKKSTSCARYCREATRHGYWRRATDGESKPMTNSCESVSKCANDMGERIKELVAGKAAGRGRIRVDAMELCFVVLELSFIAAEWDTERP